MQTVTQEHEHRLLPWHIRVLSRLAQYGDLTPPIRQMAADLSIHVSKVSRAVGILVRGGLVTRKTDPVDTRRWVLSITLEGALLLKETAREADNKKSPGKPAGASPVV